MTDLLLQSASELRRLVGRGELSAVELIEATLQRIEESNGEINAVVTLEPRARQEARALDARRARGEELGPLHGLPVGIKDVTPVAGLRTTYGSPLYADHVPEEDAEVVRRLRAAGAVVIGKTNTPEFATGANTFNEVFGRTRNPWNLERSAGGSTGGGAAALATGMIALAEGTDLGGSLRIPAAFCGVVGMRPSPGLVPTSPSDYLWDTLQVTGPMARRAEDVALMLQAVAGPSARAPLAQPITGRDFVAAVARADALGVRLAYAPDVAGIGVDPAIEGVCRAAAMELRQAGARVEETDLDLEYGKRSFLALRGYWMVAQQHPRLERIERFGDNLRGNVEAGLRRSVAELAEAEALRGRLWDDLRRLFERCDLLLTPCVAVPPFPVGQNYPDAIAGRPMRTYVDWIAPTFVLSLAGLPIASVPAGLDPEGLPVGLQIVGPPRGEEAVLAMARILQEARPVGLPSMR
ncbi:MAG TPA: amidase family protein [Thermoanaerobaculia bacterium]|nr:amidase family protein [Thermoanaerobaculia bacterium]